MDDARARRPKAVRQLFIAAKAGARTARAGISASDDLRAVDRGQVDQGVIHRIGQDHGNRLRSGPVPAARLEARQAAAALVAVDMAFGGIGLERAESVEERAELLSTALDLLPIVAVEMARGAGASTGA